MEKLFPSAFLCLILSFALTFNSCVTRENWEEEASMLIQRGTNLEHQHQKLDVSIDSLWDITTQQLAKVLPVDLPPIDRDIFLNARNADHIRMFMSYNELDPAIQGIVNTAGMYDEMLAERIRSLSEQRLQFEREKNQFLQKVEQQNAAAGKIYAEKFRMNNNNISL